MFNVSGYELIVPRISILKFSNKFTNSILVTPLIDLVDLIPFPCFSFLWEYFLQRSMIYSNGF